MSSGQDGAKGFSGDTHASKQLMANDFVYERLLREVERKRKRNAPDLLSYIEAVAGWAWSSHPGRLSDGRLENILLEIGRGLTGGSAPLGPLGPLGMPKAASSSRTLHVATSVAMTGGHSRVLAKWVQRDLSSSHAIVLTSQSEAIPAYLEEIAAGRGAPVVKLNRGEGPVERARRLRALSGGFDRIILHHHPNDVVPVIAYAKPGGPPVAMFNHAHYWFSLGSGVADVIINTTSYFQRLTLKQRFPRATALLRGPIGLGTMRWTDIDKGLAKTRLGLPADRPVLMTIGSEIYFTPLDGQDFFRTLASVLEARPDVHVLVVGVPEHSPLVPRYIRETGRVRLVGRVIDPRPYYEAADVCLESFPMPSLGATVEAVAFGEAFPVPAFAESENPMRVDLERIASIAVRQRNEADYIRYVIELLDTPEATSERARALRHVLIQDDQTFDDQFASLYDQLARFDHSPHDLPHAPCSSESENIDLASLTKPVDFANGINYLLPLGTALSSHRRAIALDRQSPRGALFGLARRFARSGFRSLPVALQQHLRTT